MNHLGKVDNDDLENFTPVTDLELDSGIRRAVLILRRGGIETFESCEGGNGHAFTEPTIRFHGDTAAGFKAYAVAKDYGLPVYGVQLAYRVMDGMLTGPWWEMVLSTKDRSTVP
ncbi:MAG: hypothetical protein Q8L89_02770 [Gammaproteobacteria bacterium]|nr:hypothetical protein [Gammaproteobacteria bacterium]